jgi:hypothetical protein
MMKELDTRQWHEGRSALLEPKLPPPMAAAEAGHGPWVEALLQTAQT